MPTLGANDQTVQLHGEMTLTRTTKQILIQSIYNVVLLYITLTFHSIYCRIPLELLGNATIGYSTVLHCNATVCQVWQQSNICFHSRKPNLSQADIKDLITMTTKGGIMTVTF